MKRILYISAALLLVLSSCKRNEIVALPLATVSVVNTVNGGRIAKLNTNLRDSCLNMSYKHFSIVAGNTSAVNVFPNGSSTTPYFSQNLATKAGDLYSLFLTGTDAAPEAVLVKDIIPPYPAEDVINVRLVNLSPGSVPLSLTLGNEPLVNVFSGIAYKQVSEFKTLSFPMTLPVNRSQFQIRNGAGDLLFTYIMPVAGTVSQTASRRRNISITVKGLTGGTGTTAFGVIVLPHY